jgi:hypothetical protein
MKYMLLDQFIVQNHLLLVIKFCNERTKLLIKSDAVRSPQSGLTRLDGTVNKLLGLPINHQNCLQCFKCKHLEYDL